MRVVFATVKPCTEENQKALVTISEGGAVWSHRVPLCQEAGPAESSDDAQILGQQPHIHAGLKRKS